MPEQAGRENREITRALAVTWDWNGPGLIFQNPKQSFPQILLSSGATKRARVEASKRQSEIYSLGYLENKVHQQRMRGKETCCPYSTRMCSC